MRCNSCSRELEGLAITTTEDCQILTNDGACPICHQVLSKRGRGRPRKAQPKDIRLVGDGVSKKRGRPRKASGVDGGEPRGRGRPRKAQPKDIHLVGDGVSKKRGRPRKASGVDGGEPRGRGRPRKAQPKDIRLVGDGVSKKRGRPRKASGVDGGEPKRPRKLSGKPLGRPRKSDASVVVNPTLDQVRELEGKLKNLIAGVGTAALAIMPSLNHETPIHALKELLLFSTSLNDAPQDVQQQPTQDERSPP